jgi:RNA polymerase subunit RPABC4/transcription elongation factor Spt4
MTQYAYCNICKKQVEDPIRKPLETFQKVVWIILIIATAGIVAIIYAFYIVNKPKSYCPVCLTKLTFTTAQIEEEKEEETRILTPKEKVLKKVGKEVKKKGQSVKIDDSDDDSKKLFCPYCGEVIDPEVKKCPYCHTNLKA